MVILVPSEVVSPGSSDHKVQLPVWMMEIGQKNKRGKSCVLEDKWVLRTLQELG